MNILFISIGYAIIVGIVIFSLIRKIILQEQLKKYEKIRYILIHKLGVIKAESFSYGKLAKIYSKLKKRKDEFKENPLILYDIISNIEKNF